MAVAALPILGKNMNQTQGGSSAGNIFNLSGGQASGLNNNAYQSVQNDIANGQNFANDPGTVAGQVQNNAVLGGLFGQGGQLSQAENQVTDLTNNGFNLTDTDKTAYGQAAGNIARQFGQNEQSLSQSLSDRGLSNSGIAGQEFSNSLGNKNEQLAGLQTQIAQNRMQMNQQRLAQTQNFMAQLGGQAQNALNSQSGQNLSNFAAQRANNEAIRSGAQSLLGAQQGQANEQQKQIQQSQRPSDFSTGLSGALAIGGTAAKMSGA